MEKVYIIGLVIVTLVTLMLYKLYINYQLKDMTGNYKYVKGPKGNIIYIQYKDGDKLKFRKGKINEINTLSKLGYLKNKNFDN